MKLLSCVGRQEDIRYDQAASECGWYCCSCLLAKAHLKVSCFARRCSFGQVRVWPRTQKLEAGASHKLNTNQQHPTSSRARNKRIHTILRRLCPYQIKQDRIYIHQEITHPALPLPNSDTKEIPGIAQKKAPSPLRPKLRPSVRLTPSPDSTSPLPPTPSQTTQKSAPPPPTTQ